MIFSFEWPRLNQQPPMGSVLAWKPGILLSPAIADAIIAIVSFAVAISLIRFLFGNRNFRYRGSIVFFSCFAVTCGITHLIGLWSTWEASEALFLAAKWVVAVAAIPTAVLAILLAPQVLALAGSDTAMAANSEKQGKKTALGESEERFRQMAENIQEIFWMMDPKTKQVTYVSPAYEKLCELPLEYIYANPASYGELIHPSDKERVLAGLKKLKSANRFDEELRIVCPSGAIKWVRAIGFQAKDSEGVLQNFVGTVQEITYRKVLEVALRESEDLFRDMVEHSSDLICTHTLDGRILSINEMPARLLGYTKEEFLAKPMAEFLLPEARPQFTEFLKNVERDSFAKGLIVVLAKSGERRIWEYHNTLRTDGVSAPIVRGMAHDVTEQKRMERALRLSEEKFSKSFLASPYAIVISTLEEGRLVEVNDSFLRIMGFTREESIGRSSFDLALWTSCEDRNAILEEIRSTGRVQSKEMLFQTKSGQRLIVNYSAEVIQLEGRSCLLSVCEDITDRKQGEARLREYEEALESVEEMIAVVDRHYCYLLANRSFVNIRSKKREEVVGKKVYEVLSEDYFTQTVKPKLDEAFLGNVVKYETRYKYPEAGERDVFVAYLPIEGATGVDRVICVLHDITDRKHADAELRRLSGQLLRLQDEERRKIARDLHDITGQDLVALATTLSQLHETIPASCRKGRKLADQCQGLAERGLREIRTLSYMLHPPMLDEAGLEDAIRHYAEGFGERTGIEVNLEVSPHFGRLPQEVELGLFRVFQESLTNIQRHSGSYTVKIHLERNPEAILLHVGDTGRGISAIKQRQNGAIPLVPGVGIPSMEERVKQVGGKLEIETSNHGTTVLVTVPLHG